MTTAGSDRRWARTARTGTRVLAGVALLVLVACSGAKPVPSGAASSGAPSAGASSSSAPNPSSPSATTTTSAQPTGSGSSVPAPVGTAEPSVPPAAGTYTYKQSGGTEARGLTLPVAETGTLRIDPPTAAGAGARQRHFRTYSENETGDTVLLFTDDGVYVESTKATIYGISQECQTEEPLLGVKLPLRVGATWSDSGSCDDLQLSVTGKVLRTERYRVGGRSIMTYVVRVIAKGTGGQGEQTTTETMWLSSAYRLTVHGESDVRGTSQGSYFTRAVTETLTSLTPA